MKIIYHKTILFLFIVIGIVSHLKSQRNNKIQDPLLNSRQQSIIIISSYTAKGDLSQLKKALNNGLNSGLTVNEIKEILVHLYVYCGFPRSIRGLQTFMEVIEDRKNQGIKDIDGKDISPIKRNENKYERGKKILEELTKTQQPEKLSGYSAFAPIIDTFLKEHLFADIFERDIITYAERELVTISAISAIGKAEPMLRSHLNICLNVGWSPRQLQQFTTIIKTTLKRKEAASVRKIVNEIVGQQEKNT